MASKFKRKEPVRKAIKRLGRQRLEKAMASLKHCDRLAAVHNVRKEIKQLRALFRLVRAALYRKEYRRVSKRLRKAADCLSAARDAQVKLNTLRNLITRSPQNGSPRSFPKLKRILTADCRNQRAKLSKVRAPKVVHRFLKRVCRDLPSVRNRRSGWRTLAPGLRRSYSDGRRCFQVTHEDPTPEHFHEWRKRVKDLFYQTGLLCPIWPEQMAAAEAELKALGECLGDDHDLFLLVEACATEQAGTEGQALRALAGRRQKELQARALAVGGRFYREDPLEFCQRLKNYWKKWRRPEKAGGPRTQQRTLGIYLPSEPEQSG